MMILMIMTIPMLAMGKLTYEIQDQNIIQLAVVIVVDLLQCLLIAKWVAAQVFSYRRWVGSTRTQKWWYHFSLVLFYAAPSTKFILKISLNESHYIHLILCISFLLLLAIGSTFLLLDLIPGSPFPNPHCLTADPLNLPPPPHWLNGSCHNHPHLCLYNLYNMIII